MGFSIQSSFYQDKVFQDDYITQLTNKLGDDALYHELISLLKQDNYRTSINLDFFHFQYSNYLKIAIKGIYHIDNLELVKIYTFHNEPSQDIEALPLIYHFENDYLVFYHEDRHLYQPGTQVFLRFSHTKPLSEIL